MKIALIIILWIWTVISLGILFPWYIAFGFFVIGGIGLIFCIDDQGSYDFFTPMLQLGLILLVIGSGVGYLIGKFVF